LLLVAYFNYLE